MFMHICFVLQIGEKEFDLFYAWLACLSPCICIHVSELSLHIYYVYWDAWVKGELLWSFTLIHAYITSWVLSSSKKGEKYFRYICMFWKRISCLCILFCFAKRRKEFDEFYAWLACLSPYICIHVCLDSCALLPYIIVYCDAWVEGELLWSFTLIHAYITPWVLSSSKRGRLLAQRPITLVLMMINSCSYSTNDLVFN